MVSAAVTAVCVEGGPLVARDRVVRVLEPAVPGVSVVSCRPCHITPRCSFPWCLRKVNRLSFSSLGERGGRDHAV